MKYNSFTRRVTIDADNMKLKIRRDSTGRLHTPKLQQVTLKFNGDVARLLGLRDGTVISKGNSKSSEFAATPSGSFHQMYLYTDCIHPQPHPDGNVTILRTIAIDGEPNRQYLSKRFQSIYYFPLNVQTITTIKFDLCDDTGKHVGFDTGKVLVVLHFRKKKNL